MNKKALVIGTLTVLLAACGGGGSSSGGGSNGAGVVRFSVDPDKGPTCGKPTKRSTFQGSLWTSVDCTWYCADYKNAKNAYVSIDFRRRHEPGAKWSKSHEYISGGIC